MGHVMRHIRDGFVDIAVLLLRFGHLHAGHSYASGVSAAGVVQR